MKALKGELYFCGNCNRQFQPISKNEKCPNCGRTTVSWYTDYESSNDAMRKWKNANGR